jgi:hypothetical protein
MVAGLGSTSQGELKSRPTFPFQGGSFPLSACYFPFCMLAFWRGYVSLSWMRERNVCGGR